MDKSSADDVESKPELSEIEPTPETMGDFDHQGQIFACVLCDKEVAYKIAQDLLSGLATACVDSTTGVIFKTPASVAADLRKEMVDYLTVRSEHFVAETVVVDTDPGAEEPDNPLYLLSNMIDDFVVSQKSLFSRVSGLMLTEMREDRIDEFTQAMEKDSFWLLDKREAVAQTLIKNVDFKSHHHCNMKFGSEQELVEHQERCGYRPVMCENEGCSDMFSIDGSEYHDSICPFKILQCEQQCAELLMRRDMDKHCITDCSMKLANCSFYSVGCETPVPQSLIKKHTSENTHGHLVNVLQYIHKDASSEDAERWAAQIEKSEFYDELEARDVRTFTMAVKDIEKRIGPFEVSEKKDETVESSPAAAPSEQAASAPAKGASTAPATDHQAAAFPSKERDLPSQTPVPQAKSPPPAAAAPNANKTTPLQQRTTSTKPDHAASSTIQEKIETSPPAIKPEQTVTQKETKTAPSKQRPASPPTATLQENAVITPEAVASSPLQDSATADVQEHTSKSPSTDRDEPVSSLQQAQTSPPRQPLQKILQVEVQAPLLSMSKTRRNPLQMSLQA